MQLKLTSHPLDNFPFKSYLSFDLLMDYWQSAKGECNEIIDQLTEKVVAYYQAHPELQGRIENPEILAEHEKFLSLAMSALFSYGTWETDIKGVVGPFSGTNVYYTPRYQEILSLMEGPHSTCSTDEAARMIQMKMLMAYIFVMEKFFGIQLNFDKEIIQKVTDPVTGLQRYYQVNVNRNYADITTIGPVPQLSPDELQELLAHLDDLDYWMAKLPPENFVFEGIIVLQFNEVTEQEVTSLIKQSLLKKDMLLKPERFKELEGMFRNLLGQPELRLSMASFHKIQSKLLTFGLREEEMFAMLGNDCPRIEVGKNTNCMSLFHRKTHLLIDDVNRLPNHDPLKQRLIAQGVANTLIVPLLSEQDDVMGLVQLSMPKPNQINPLTLFKLRELFPMITAAVKAASDELDHQVEEVIKDQFTLLHPTVEWKFHEVANRFLEKKRAGNEENMDPIVFENVFPLFGASDIRNSSLERNTAIQADLIEQLSLARTTIQAITQKYPLPVYECMDYDIELQINRIENRLLSEDEVTIIDLLKNKIEPFFKHMADEDLSLKPATDRYFAHLDATLGVVYKRRKAFEESVMKINRIIAGIFEEEERKTQQMFPYYSEIYKTDGVEYNLYIGQSLVNGRKYHPMFLSNLRLWQLMMMCRITRKTQQLKYELPIALETTQLILIQDTPLSITFRADEKKFDVDGAYNIRYEIMKKRIDKAVVKGTGERLTQPGTIAIVYSNNKEESEILHHLRYLKHLGYTEGEEEFLALEELQGVSGLKALRIKVSLPHEESWEATHQEKVSNLAAVVRKQSEARVAEAV